MRYLLVALTYLAIGSLAAETIGNVEYHLPTQEQVWKVVDELKTEEPRNSLTLVYIPENESKQESKEFFVAHVNSLSTDLSNAESLEKGLQQVFQVKFPEAEVKLDALDIFPKLVLYEFSIHEHGHEKVHGWIRAFSSPKQTVLLTYQTEIVNQVEEIRPIWIQVLKEAKELE